MNVVTLIGRLTKDPVISYTQEQVAIARFSVAIGRGKDKNGNDRGADYPSVIAFGKTAELVDRFLGKGRLVGVTGKLQTGSYEKDGRKTYTTDVVADRVEFLDKAPESPQAAPQPTQQAAPQAEEQVSMYEEMIPDEDFPF